MMKKVKRVQSREGIILIVDADELEQLRAYSEMLDDLRFSYTKMSGAQYKCEGCMAIEENTKMDSRTTVNVYPRDGWVLF